VREGIRTESSKIDQLYKSKTNLISDGQLIIFD